MEKIHRHILKFVQTNLGCQIDSICKALEQNYPQLQIPSEVQFMVEKQSLIEIRVSSPMIYAGDRLETIRAFYFVPGSRIIL